MQRNRLVLIGLATSLGIVFGGCSLVAKQADVTTETPTQVLSGVVSVSNNIYYLMSSDRKSTEIDSRKVDLSAYVGKTIKATGEFSGTTLFVDKVE